MSNPFEVLSNRLETIEGMLSRLLLHNSTPITTPDVGGMEVAQQVTRLSKPRIYALVTDRDPHKRLPSMKRGNKLYFSRVALLEWVAKGNRGGHNE